MTVRNLLWLIAATGIVVALAVLICLSIASLRETVDGLSAFGYAASEILTRFLN